MRERVRTVQELVDRTGQRQPADRGQQRGNEPLRVQHPVRPLVIGPRARIDRFGIYLDDSRPIETAGTDGATAVALRSHDAVQVVPPGFGCGIDIAISTTSSVAVNVSTSANDCPVALTYAQLIEPKLPAQQK